MASDQASAHCIGLRPVGEILEEADRLPLEDQETLIEILQRHMRDRRRAELAEDVFRKLTTKEGSCRPATTGELIREILS